MIAFITRQVLRIKIATQRAIFHSTRARQLKITAQCAIFYSSVREREICTICEVATNYIQLRKSEPKEYQYFPSSLQGSVARERVVEEAEQPRFTPRT